MTVMMMMSILTSPSPLPPTLSIYILLTFHLFPLAFLISLYHSLPSTIIVSGIKNKTPVGTPGGTPSKKNRAKGVASSGGKLRASDQAPLIWQGLSSEQLALLARDKAR